MVRTGVDVRTFGRPVVKFMIGTQVMLRPGKDAVFNAFSTGKIYEVGGKYDNDDTFIAIKEGDHGRPDQWFTRDFVFAEGPW